MKQFAVRLLAAAAVAATADAARYDVVGRIGRSARLQRRDGSHTVFMDNQANTQYSMNITLGGQSFDVIVDAGRRA
jgi:predicted aspartyl protease